MLSNCFKASRFTSIFYKTKLKNYSPFRLFTSSKCCFKFDFAIRREDNSAWERRAPLSPSHVKELVRDGIKIAIQPSDRRVFTIDSYIAAGAVVEENLNDVPVIIGVKDAPVNLIMPNKTYVFFSHTHKAQISGMPLLDTMLERNNRLIDYERMHDETGKRLVAFGKFAGVSGMINILHGLGLRLLALGYHTPFMFIGPTQTYASTHSLKQAVRDAGYEIALGNMPKSLGSLVFVFTGTGNVSKGAMEVFENFPHEVIHPENIADVASNGSTNKLYCTTVSRKDHLVHKDGSPYDEQDYSLHPQNYFSTFSSKIAPYATCIINGTYWEKGSPRLLTIPDAKLLYSYNKKEQKLLKNNKLAHRLLAISDISADPGGSIQFMEECTTIDKPFCLYDAKRHKDYESFKGEGVLICSIDNMPTQLPHEATEFFGSLLMPYIKDILKSDATTPFEDFKVSRVATICSNGQLTPNFSHINDLRKQNRINIMHCPSGIKNKILILGSGYVSEPLVEYLSRDETNGITIASNVKNQVEFIADKYKNTTPIQLDAVKGTDEMEKYIKSHDLVVSILPYGLHTVVAKLCIKHKKDLATASYLLPELKALNEDAKKAGITIFNEIGLDPGIDHMVAMEAIDQIKLKGGKVTSYKSWCGGLPSPECCNNPLNYKFSWSPKASLMSFLNGAKYLENGKVITIDENGKILSKASDVDFQNGFKLEAYPNRNSIPYLTSYGIETANNVMRGTLRYKGFSKHVQSLIKLGFLSQETNNVSPIPDISKWKYLSALNNFGDISKEQVILKIQDMFQDDKTVQLLEKLGLLDDEPMEVLATPLDTLALHLGNELAYKKGERDMIIMRTEIGAKYQDKTETTVIDMVVYGNEQMSAMAATVGYPLGIACQMILNNEIERKGTIVPYTADIYETVLKRISLENINSVIEIKSD